MACPAPPYTIVQTPFHLYMNVPFNVPAQQIELRTPCNENHPGKDYLFNGAQFDVTPVFAIESGTLEYALPGFIGIKGNDGILTEYVHVQPREDLVQAANRGEHPPVNAREQIAMLAQIGEFTGTPTPHVHINRKRTWTFPVCQQEFTCDWGVDGIDNRQQTGTCPNANGWSSVNNELVFCRNGTRQRGRVQIGTDFFFFDPTTGVFTGFAQNSQGTFFFWNGTGWDLIE